MEFISEFSNTSAVDVMNFIKEVVEKFPNLRNEILARLLSTLSDIKAKKVFRGALWILGEYCINEKDIMNALRGIRNSVGELPILDAEQRLLEKHDVDNMDGENEATAHVSKGARRVLADGTYATESAFTESKDAAKAKAVNGVLKTPLRCMLLFFPPDSSPDFEWRLLSGNYPRLDSCETGYSILRNCQ
jgi:coatomer subunit beta